jgi:hypothetical protein
MTDLRPYLRPFDGTGDTPEANSLDLIEKAKAVLVLASCEYLKRGTQGGSLIQKEIRAMNRLSKEIPIVALGIDTRKDLKDVPNWSWSQIKEGWNDNDVVIPDEFPLRDANEATLREALDEALKRIDQWSK